jgi:Tol biopolymer transport system component
MKKNKRITAMPPILVILLILASAPALFPQQKTRSGSMRATDAYLQEPRPGVTPRMFAPGRISDGMPNRDMAISPSGTELFYTVQAPGGQLSAIVCCHWMRGAWSKPEVAPFSGRYCDLEPAFSYDANTLFFASNRQTLKDYDIWMVQRTAGKWGQPTRLDTLINTAKDEFYPSVARSGNLYFTRVMDNGKGKEDIAISEWKDGHFQTPYSVPGGVNSEHYEFNAFVDPDEKYLLFTSLGRKEDMGGGDLYLSFKNEQGEWMPAIHLDSTINSTALDFSPYVSPDKKYLFFTSERIKMRPPFTRPLNFDTLKAFLTGPGNSMNDIYWMDWPSLLKKYVHDS